MTASPTPSGMRTADLLPCPFCNGYPIDDHVSHWTGMQSIIVGGRLRHHCRDESAYMEFKGRTPVDAIAAWNRRAGTADAARAAREEMRERCAKRCDELSQVAYDDFTKWCALGVKVTCGSPSYEDAAACIRALPLEAKP